MTACCVVSGDFGTVILGVSDAVGLNVIMSPLCKPIASCLPRVDQDTDFNIRNEVAH